MNAPRFGHATATVGDGRGGHSTRRATAVGLTLGFGAYATLAPTEDGGGFLVIITEPPAHDAPAGALGPVVMQAVVLFDERCQGTVSYLEVGRR